MPIEMMCGQPALLCRNERIALYFTGKYISLLQPYLLRRMLQMM